MIGVLTYVGVGFGKLCAGRETLCVCSLAGEENEYSTLGKGEWHFNLVSRSGFCCYRKIDGIKPGGTYIDPLEKTIQQYHAVQSGLVKERLPFRQIGIGYYVRLSHLCVVFWEIEMCFPDFPSYTTYVVMSCTKMRSPEFPYETEILAKYCILPGTR